MAGNTLTPEELERRLKAIAEYGTISAASEALGIPRTTLAHTVETMRRVPGRAAIGVISHPGRHDIGLENGTILVGSDAHIWPGPPSTAMRAFMWAIRRFRKELSAVILNGDVVDGASISRHPSIGWESKPKLIDELGAVQKQLREMRSVGGSKAEYIWTLGNHDSRFETAIANALPNFAGVEGVHLKDHFPDWEPAWSCWINDDLVVKHRFKGGMHATWNNTVYSGKSMATGHLHSLRVTPFSDYNGTRWGVDTGTLSTPYGPQFIHYTEGNPVNWRAGFVVFTFRAGELLQPELVIVRDEQSWQFRGQVFDG